MTFAVTATPDGSTLSGTATGTLLMTDFSFEPPAIPIFMTAENEVLVTVDFTAMEVGSLEEKSFTTDYTDFHR